MSLFYTNLCFFDTKTFCKTAALKRVHCPYHSNHCADLGSISTFTKSPLKLVKLLCKHLRHFCQQFVSCIQLMPRHGLDEKENITVTAIDISDSNETPWRLSWMCSGGFGSYRENQCQVQASDESTLGVVGNVTQPAKIW